MFETKIDTKMESELKKKIMVAAMWGCEDNNFWSHQWCRVFEKILGEVVSFDPRKRKLKVGSKRMREELFNIVKEKKPDFFIFLIESNDINIETIRKINKISPKTKTIVHFGDDDLRFENRSRYYALFTDYCMVPQIDKMDIYKKEGIKKAHPIIGANTNHFKPLDVEKIYDVSFIGSPLPSRVEYIEYLIDNGIKVKLWGNGWYNYPEFSGIYEGPLKSEDIHKVVNQTKINLGFTKNYDNIPHFKGRIFDVYACKSFQLVDYYSEYKKYFKENKEIVFFRSKEELLEKIKYYLKNENEMKKIAERGYLKTINENDYLVLFKKFFLRIIIESGKFKRAELPELKKSYLIINRDDIMKDNSELIKICRNYNFIGFSDGANFSEYKNYLQAYSLEKTQKDLSCCGYFAYNKKLGNYLTFNVIKAMKSYDIKEFSGLFNLQQIIARKDFFFKNIDKFREAFIYGKIIDFVNKDNTAFISIPLLGIERLNEANIETLRSMKFERLEKTVQLNYLFELYVRAFQKRIFTDPYLYNLIWESLFKNKFFILNSIGKYVFKNETLKRIGMLNNS